MKKPIVTAFIAALLLPVAQPAPAADFARMEEHRPGAFGGVRLRIPLGGPSAGSVRAGLTIAPTLQSRDLQGVSRTRVGEGLELGIAGNERLTLSLAGRPVSRLAPGPAAPEGRRMGVSTLGWIAIGAGVAAVGTAIWFYAAITDDDRCCE